MDAGQKFIGSREYMDTQTGEVITAEVIIKDTDKDFRKIWVGHILETIDELGGARIMALFWLMEYVDNKNRILGTIRELAKWSNVSLDTMARLMVALQKANIIRRERVGCYIFNPAVMFKGGHHKRMDVLLRYRDLSQSLPGMETEANETETTEVA